MFTKRSTLGSVAVGLIVAATFERFLGTPVGLAATNGLAAMTLGVLAGSLGHTNAINGNEGARASTPAPEREGTRAARG